MSSLRMTFSLASLVLIFALAFVAMPAMAATGGPTVTLTEYSGVDDPAAATAGQDMHTQARDDFRVLLTFSHSVAAPISSDVMYRSKGADGRFGNATAIDANPVAVLNSGGKKYVATLPAAAITDATTQVNVSIADDAVSGDTTNLLGIVGNSMTFTLPPLNVGTVMLAAPKAVAGTPGSYTIVATFDSKADPAATHTLSPAFAASYIDIMPEGAADPPTIGNVDTSTDNKAVVTITVQLKFGTTEARVSIDPGYVAGSNTITLPPAAPVAVVPPTATLSVPTADHDAAARTFKVVLTLSKDHTEDLDIDDLKVTDASTPAATVSFGDPGDIVDERKTKRMYTAILKYGLLDNLPLTVTTAESLTLTGDAPTAMVGMAPDTTAPTVTSNAPTNAITSATTVTLTFSESVSGVNVVGNPTGATAKYMMSAITGTGMTRMVTITPIAAADLTADVAETPVTFTVTGQDAAENPIAAGATFMVTLAAREAPDDIVIREPDTTRPTFRHNAPRTPITSTTTVTLTFNEAVTGVTVTGNPTGDNAKYSITEPVARSANEITVQITPWSRAALAADESLRVVRFTVAGADTTGNRIADGSGFDIHLAPRKTAPPDTTAPVLTSSQTADDTTGVVDVMLTFNEALSAAPTVSAAHSPAALAGTYTVSAVTGTASPYTVTVTPLAATTADIPAGTVTLTVSAMDESGNTITTDNTVAVMLAARTAEPVKAKATFSGTLSLTGSSVVTVTLSKPAVLTEADFDVEPEDAEVTRVRAKAATETAPANTVWQVAFDAGSNPFMEPVSLTIAESSAVAEPADTMGSLMTRTPDAVLNTITAATGADDTEAFLVSFTFETELPDGVLLKASDIKVTPATVTKGTPGVTPANAKIWQVQITPTAGMDTKIELSDAGKVKFGTSASALTVNKSSTPTPTSAEDTLSGLSVPAESFVVIVRDANVQGLPDTLPANAKKVMWPDMPDLEALLYEGGSIILTRAKTPKLDHDADSATDARDAAARDLVITEVMWAKNTALTGKAGELYHQWIEVYNPLETAVGGVTLKTKGGRPALDKTGDDVLLDRLSNQVGNGWELSGLGQSGSMDTDPNTNEVNFISMFRKERGKDGWVKGHWAQSTEIAITGHLATPGRLERKKSTAISVTDSPSSPFVINEFGIGNDDGEDWVELRNVTSDNQNLKNYLLTSVPALDKEDIEFHFHDKNLPVPPNGIVVVVSRDPRDSDMATGFNLEVAADDQEEKGAQHLYVVRSFELPTGKFNLILRKGYNNKPEDFTPGKKVGTDNLVDSLGSLKLSKETATFKSDFWPLNGKGAPHGDVIDGKGQDFKAGTVYVRNKPGKNEGTGEHHLAVVGYTGIGYDRAAATTAENGGTPGYDNGSTKGKQAELSGAKVTFSEIMLDTGPKNRRLPQWIELYNSSMTHTVDLNGWKLTIENSATDDAIRTRVDATITLKSTRIFPNQTVLIVSTAGLNSGDFPRNRVINLWTDKDHRTALGTTSRTEQVFSTVGLYLKLTDADNKLVDEFGNLDGLSRTRRETPTWEFPMNEDNGDDRRSSLIRRYVADGDGTTLAEVVTDGTLKDAWVLASKTNFANVIAKTHYGAEGDFGTPGYRVGGPLPVSLSKFRPERLKDTGEVVVRWITESELNNAGFNILRSEKRDSDFTKVHYVAGQGTTSERTTYEWKDTSAKPNVVYYYQIQDVSLDGEVTTLRTTHLRGNVTAAGKATTTWGEIKALQ